MTPLLQPADCCVLLIDPRRQNIGTLEQPDQQALIHCFNLVQTAVSTAAVPLFFAIEGASSDVDKCFGEPFQASSPRVHRLGDNGQSWTNSGIAAALAAEKRDCLVLGGFWLETTVTFMALHALSNGFDVFLLMDATPSRAQDARVPSANRLLQAGIVPTTTHQLVAEWAEQVTDQTLRMSLAQLIRIS